MIVGPNIIKSTNFNVIMRGYYADFEGKGWGHGVGLCQWGAKGMADCGFKYDEILKYYYPGAEITK
jgi:stage II sporulation protein D